MKRVGVFAAKTHFSALISSVEHGETIIVTKKGVPVARIVPMSGETSRAFGVARKLFETGAIVVHDDFDDPLPSELLREFDGS